MNVERRRYRVSRLYRRNAVSRILGWSDGVSPLRDSPKYPRYALEGEAAAKFHIDMPASRGAAIVSRYRAGTVSENPQTHRAGRCNALPWLKGGVS